jgi:valyl-tRNA synthetase
VSEEMAQVRRAKTEAKVSQRAAVDTVVVHSTDADRAAIEAGLADVRDAGSIASVTFAAGDQIVCEVTLAPVAESPTT